MSTQVSVDIELGYGEIILTLRGKAEELYYKFKESESDEDFEELADWIQDDVADQLDFSISSIWES